MVVVEARERSGSLITAGHAANQGVDVFAVPGPITAPTSAGPNRLLRDGAYVVLEAADVLHEMGIPAPTGTRAPTPSATDPSTATAVPRPTATAAPTATSTAVLPGPRPTAIPIGTLVELDNGVRLFVVYHGRDCDQTPLYYLSYDPEDTKQERNGWKNRSWTGGFGEENLTTIHE